MFLNVIRYTTLFLNYLIVENSGMGDRNYAPSLETLGCKGYGWGEPPWCNFSLNLDRISVEDSGVELKTEGFTFLKVSQF